MIDYNPDTLKSFNLNNAHLLNVLKEVGHFTYIPNSGNLGDMMIAHATLDFFDTNNIAYSMFDGSPSDIIVYGGGGQWTADYKRHWKKWLPLFKRAQRIVLLPSSFNNCAELIEVLDSRFTVLCRECQSFQYLQQAQTDAEILLDHDMAFRLIPNCLNGRPVSLNSEQENAINSVVSTIPESRSVLRLMRTDCERVHDNPTDLDLSAVIYGSEFSSRQHIAFCTDLMMAAVNLGDKIITDRLHVAIAACFLNKEVCMIDNSYGKLANVYMHTMHSFPNVKFFQSLSDVSS